MWFDCFLFSDLMLVEETENEEKTDDGEDADLENEEDGGTEEESEAGVTTESEDSAAKEADEFEQYGEKREELKMLKNLIEYLEDMIGFIQQFHAVVPVLCKYLRSRTQSDVIEAIHFFTVTCNFNLDFTFIGVREMLEQIWDDDAKIKECVVSAYKALYFDPECNSARLVFLAEF